jgi:hypothetical protein
VRCTRVRDNGRPIRLIGWAPAPVVISASTYVPVVGGVPHPAKLVRALPRVAHDPSPRSFDRGLTVDTAPTGLTEPHRSTR